MDITRGQVDIITIKEMLDILARCRDAEKNALDQAIANGLNELDPFRNWLEGRYLGTKHVVDTVESYL